MVQRRTRAPLGGTNRGLLLSSAQCGVEPNGANFFQSRQPCGAVLRCAAAVDARQTSGEGAAPTAGFGAHVLGGPVRTRTCCCLLALPRAHVHWSAALL